MDQRLRGRTAIVTGAGRGLGRAHALELARQGAAVVVNDLGAGLHGEPEAGDAATAVVAEIEAAGGRAVASGHDVADWSQAEALIALAVEAFGELHVLVNNAGILRDRTLAKMTESEWDAVVHVHLKGHAAPTRHALAHWRERSKAGSPVQASVIHTSSISGLAGQIGQANYAAAKMGIVGLSRVTALEGAPYGVRSNVVSPSARTRMTLETPGMEEMVRAPEDPDALDAFDPANVSPVVAWLAEAGCPATSQILQVWGDRVVVFELPVVAADLRAGERWTPERLDALLAPALVRPLDALELLDR